jgi:GNAT superfamily N-acetyltransferase
MVLSRLDRAERKSSVAAWRAAAEAGYAIDVEEDGDLAMCASPDIPGPAFNQASGPAQLPNLMGMATDFYDRHGTTGYLWLEDPPWPDAKMSLAVDVFAAAPEDVAEAPVPQGVVIRQIKPGEAAAYTAVRSGNETAGGVARGGPNPWPDVYDRLARTSSRLLFVAELDGKPVGNGSLHIEAHTGWLRGALVAPEARGRGIQRALITARVEAAIRAGCDLVGASAGPEEVSARNLERMGMIRIGHRSSYEYVPASADGVFLRQ